LLSPVGFDPFCPPIKLFLVAGRFVVEVILAAFKF